MGLLIPAPVGAKVGEDYQERLGITKYDPTSDRILTRAGNGMAEVDPGFLPTYGVGSLRRDRIFEDGEIVYYTEKCHGSCFASVFTSDKFWVKSHHVMRKPPHEVTAKELARYDRDLFIYRLKSIVNPMLRLCRLPQFKAPVKPFTVKEDVFWQTARLYGLEEICRANPNLAFYGEVYGTTQKGYMYDSIGEPKFACFDIYNIKTQSYMDCEEMMHICKRFNVQTVPELYVGPYSIDKVKELSEGKTTLGGKHLREGVVVKSAPGRPRKIAKYVSTSYLLEQGKE
jgi:RNA ligase (TIGR02306 family)